MSDKHLAIDAEHQIAQSRKVKALTAELSQWRQRAEKAEALAERRRKDYVDVADAITRESSSAADLAAQARAIRQDRDRLSRELVAIRARNATMSMRRYRRNGDDDSLHACGEEVTEAINEFQAQRDAAESALAVAVQALELIAAPKRPDGTYNRCREACEDTARRALEQIQKSASSE